MRAGLGRFLTIRCPRKRAHSADSGVQGEGAAFLPLPRPARWTPVWKIESSPGGNPHRTRQKSGRKKRNGKIGAPVKGATLIGNGPDVLTRVKMIGNDMQLDPGVGTCGKDGQGVPVGVGQPSLLVENITVGGTTA